MARAEYIWIATTGGMLLAAFTVKHEMLTWLRRAVLPEALDHVDVVRIRDGGHGVEVQLGTGTALLAQAAP